MNSQSISLPGISPEMIAASNLQQVDANMAMKWCGMPAPGLLIPYLDFQGCAIEDQGRPFYRLRLEHPTQDGQKYHQLKGTQPHAYLPPGVAQKASSAQWIALIEGEKKALSIADLHGIVAIGLAAC